MNFAHHEEHEGFIEYYIKKSKKIIFKEEKMALPGGMLYYFFRSGCQVLMLREKVWNVSAVLAIPFSAVQTTVQDGTSSS